MSRARDADALVLLEEAERVRAERGVGSALAIYAELADALERPDARVCLRVARACARAVCPISSSACTASPATSGSGSAAARSSG